MTELIITPNYDKKTARFKGTIAGGESVKVTIVGAAKWLSSGLRLRVVCGCSLTVAMFPLKSEDGTVSSFEVVGDDLIAAPLELNTIQARLYTQGFATTAATFIVEDLEKNILYFQDSYELHGWVKRDGDEEPYDLTKFPELIEDWRKQIEGLIVDAKEVDGGIEVTICNGISPAKTFIIRNGRDGQTGETGRKGEDGKSLKFSDLTDAQKAELKGPKGDTGEGVTDELKALPNKVTENAQAIEANRVAINTEENRAKGAEKELLTRIEESKANAAAAMTAASKAQDTADKTVTEIATLVGDDAGDKRKSARQIAAEEVAKVIAGADTNYDTLKEIADYIKSDATDAAQLKNKVTNLEANKADNTALAAEVSRAKGAEAVLDGRVKELEENPSVEVVTPSGDGAGKAADAKAVYEALEGKQSKLSQEQLAAVDSGITAAKVEKLNGVEAGAQKNPDLSGYAKTADVPAAIEGKEIKPSSVVMEEYDAGELVGKTVLDAFGVNFENIPAGYKVGGGWSDIVKSMPKYIFDESELFLVNDAELGECTVFVINPYTVYRGTSEVFDSPRCLFNLVSSEEWESYARDFILVIDVVAEGECSIIWRSVHAPEITFHPRGGDTSNLEVVAGKRNVFFITEVQPNQFMVARDELELPDAGGGE